MIVQFSVQEGTELLHLVGLATASIVYRGILFQVTTWKMFFMEFLVLPKGNCANPLYVPSPLFVVEIKRGTGLSFPEKNKNIGGIVFIHNLKSN